MSEYYTPAYPGASRRTRRLQAFLETGHVMGGPPPYRTEREYRRALERFLTRALHALTRSYGCDVKARDLGPS